MGGGFEIVHLPGLHRPDKGGKENQRQQERKREGDVDGRHDIDILRSNSEFGILNSEFPPPTHPEDGSLIAVIEHRESSIKTYERGTN